VEPVQHTAAVPEPASEPIPITIAKPVPPTIIPSQARVRVAGGRLPLAESSGAAVDILLDEAPLRAMQAHALTSLDREVAGVMIGRQPEKQPDGRYVVHVIDSIIAEHTVMQGASVTYTPESWRYMTDTLWERYPDESAVIVGWYHTHPGFGIFLSGMDLFIHQNFFTQIWHVAYVLDPRARTSGFFCWNRQRTKVNRYDFLWPAWMNGSW
jgi:proteasome lid subunit RPN8/RPN11